jgi:molybdopterin-guanine dinucleotide biosynthesis protein A
LIDRFGFAEAEWPAEPFDPFVNVNDPEGVASAERLLSCWPGA